MPKGKGYSRRSHSKPPSKSGKTATISAQVKVPKQKPSGFMIKPK